MKKYTQRELCHEAFGDVMRGIGKVAGAAAKLAVPAGVELAKRAASPVTMFKQQQPANAIKEYLKSSRTVNVFNSDINENDIILGRARSSRANSTPHRLSNPSNFKESNKVDKIMLVNFDAKNFETGMVEQFTAYLGADKTGKAGYTVFAIQSVLSQ